MSLNKTTTFLLLSIIFNIHIYAIELNHYINNKNCNQIIDKQVFEICYDYNMKGAKYVTYTLKGNLVHKNNIKKRPSFYTEKTLKKEYRSYNNDYLRSGYDRGHIASDASFDYSKKTQRKTYTMANIVPQSPKLNRKTWIKVEKLERKIAVKLGSVSVINGIVYSNNPKRIGKHNIAVPIAFWKILYNNKLNYKKCFYYKNINDINIKKDKLKNHLINCNELY